MTLQTLVKLVARNIPASIRNSVIMAGLYYGFLTALALKTSYILLLRAMVRENPNNKAAAITGLILGQLGRLLSIYYAPLYIVLGRPHTLTVLTLIYFLVNLFGNNLDKHASRFGAYADAIRTLEIPCIFLNNLVLQLLNTCIFPSSTLARVVNVYLFRCNNMMVFLISSFSAWLIGQILVLKCCQLVLRWVQKKNSIRALIQKYLIQNSMIFIIVNCLFGSSLFILTIQSLGRIPLPIPTQNFSEVSLIEKREEERLNKKKSGVAKEEKPEDQPTEDGENLSHETEILKKESYSKLEDADDQSENDIEQAVGTLLFDYKRWARPFRYIKNNQFEQTVRNEMSQYFFAIQQGDGKARICFTHPVNLSMFWKGISFLSREKNYSNLLNRRWVEQNKKKLESLKINLFSRIENLDKTLRVEFETTRTRLCLHDDEIKQQYLLEEYDPLLTGAYRGRIKTEQDILPKQETETSTDLLDPSIKILEENTKDQHINIGKKIGHEKTSFDEEIQKKVPRWSYKLITELEQISYFRNPPDDHDIRTRKAKGLVVFDPSKYPNLEEMMEENKPTIQNELNNETVTIQDRQNHLKNRDASSTTSLDDDSDATTEEPKDDKRYSIRYSHQSDFRHGLIKDSMRPLRRKIVTTDFFKGSVQSPLFFERRKKKNLFSFLSGLVKFKQFFITWSAKKEYEGFENTNKKVKTRGKKRREEKERIEISEAWDSFELTQALRGFLLITQSNLRKNILLPSLIIIKNIGRILLLQTSEWSEDFEELEKETHVPCTYNGIPLGEKEFPRNWLTEGIQIKILSPFCLKPWNQDKRPLPPSENFCFLTIWGQETDHIFGRPRKTPSFFEPILMKLDKSFRKINVVSFSKERTTLEPNIMKEQKVYHITNDILNEPSNEFEFSHREKIRAITNRTSRIKIKLDQITEERDKILQGFDRIFSKKSFKRKRFQLTYHLHFFQYFLKLFLQKISNIFLFHTQLICRLINQIIDESKQGIIDKHCSKNKKICNKFFNTRRKQKSTTFNKLSDLSQAYVLYKISQQTGIFNICKDICEERSGQNHHRTSAFIKTQIKESFATHGLFQIEGLTTKIPQLRTRQWKNWLKVNVQYDLSQILWSSFIEKKRRWQKKINRYSKFNQKSLDKCNSKKRNGNNSILTRYQKDNFEKCCRYDVLSSKFINFEKKKPCFSDKLTISSMKRQRISYNKTMSQNFLFAITRNILIKNLIGKIETIEIPYVEKDLDRKYLSFENIDFSLKKKVNIESWIPLASRGGPTKTYNFELLDEMEVMQFIDQIFKKEKELVFPCLEKKNKKTSRFKFLTDWMGLNKGLLNHPVTNMEFWFFPELVSLLNVYKLKPWILNSQLLLSKLTFSKLPSKKQNQTKTKKKNDEAKSKHQSETQNKDNQKVETQQKDETNAKTKGKTSNEEKKEIVNQQNDETEEDPQLGYIKSFLKKHLNFQLRGEFVFKKSGFKNIQILCLLLRLMDENEMLLSSIQRQKLNLYIMPETAIKDLTLEVLEDMGVPEFLKEKRINFEPIPLYINKNGKSLMYQLINVSLVSKIKYSSQNQGIMKIQNKNNVASLIPENILSSRRRRELRILIYLNSNRNKKCKDQDIDLSILEKKCTKFLDEQKNIVEFFLWPNSRFEDLACMNRYWFYTNNGSRFSMLRIFMYLPLKIY
uniref:Protein TIC 214 n=1 Tax=Cuscuta bonafortunae TaxID=1197926 RepID=A0A4Y6GUX1_9ASTE|nr:Ycf1 protein [Cuscuta bonafortunae]QDF46536.1 Ycf1 protein [Cuscuta bonafortunae]